MDSPAQPQISVILPVYNSEKYLVEAVESILGQTFTDFELIAIDDCSTDNSPTILESFRQKDKRLIVERHAENQGVTAALNSGLALARGIYIARMDADDISLPDRFEKQVAFLEKHPEIDILGSAVQLVDEFGANIGMLSAPLDDLAIQWASLFSAAFMHATIMLRHSVLIEHNIQYRASRDQAQDFDLFTQLLKFACGANLAEPLYLYRIHSASVTSQYSRDNLSRKSMLIHANLQRRFPDLGITPDQVTLVSSALLGKPSRLEKRVEAADIYLRVWQAFSAGCTPSLVLSNLQTNVMMVTVKMALYPPFQPGWRKVLRRVSEIEPKWPISFIGKFPGMVSTKIHSLLIQKNRK
jgi:hypothetical protein